MRIYDAHIHLLFQCSSSELQHKFAYLHEIGVAGFDALIIPEYPAVLKTVRQMVPEKYHNEIDLDILCKQRDSIQIVKQVKDLDIVPFLDARYIETDIEQKLRMYHDQGFKGLKLLYVPEEDTVSKFAGMENAFGRSLVKSEKITSLLVDCASHYDMPVLIHVDLRKYAEFTEELLKNHPQVNFNIAHFGLSRRNIAPLLDRYPNCYTDMASLAPYIKKDPASYLDFVQYYQDRILFGSDALVGTPETILKASKYVLGCLDDTELVGNVFHENYLTFHKH
jgi:predicted TIM-barrel fold metal-dependent hydrolase